MATALEVAASILEGAPAGTLPDLPAMESIVEALARRWQGAVRAHLLAHPFGVDELDRLADGDGGECA